MSIKEECRDTDRIPWLETLVQDVRFAIRAFRRRPGFALSALTVLAFGVGSSTAIFSVVNGVLLTPLPYRDPGRLVRIFGAWEHGSREGISPADFADYRDQNTAFESVAAATNSTPLLNLKASGEPEQVPSRSITSAFFSTLGIQKLVGRAALVGTYAYGPGATERIVIDAPKGQLGFTRVKSECRLPAAIW